MKPSVAAGLQAKAAQAQASELAEVSRKLDLILATIGLAPDGSPLESEKEAQAPEEPQAETPVEPEAQAPVEPEAEDKSEAPTEPPAKPAGRGKNKK